MSVKVLMNIYFSHINKNPLKLTIKYILLCGILGSISCVYINSTENVHYYECTV